MPSAASQIWPHLPTGTPEPVQQRTPTVADAMFPNLSRAAKAQEAQQQRWDAMRKQQRDNHLRGLRQANANLDKSEGRDR